MTIPADPRPCSSCPYATATPPGVWEPDEYLKLPGYGANESFSVFLCHQGPMTGRERLCRGWLWVERESAAVRLGVLSGLISDPERYRDPGVACYESGEEAAEAGLEDCADPPPAARALIDSLLAKRQRAGLG